MSNAKNDKNEYLIERLLKTKCLLRRFSYKNKNK